MRLRGKHRNSWAIAASLLAHIAVLALLLTHHWDLDLPPQQPDAPWEHVINVEMARHVSTPAKDARPTRVLGRAPGHDERPLPLPPPEPAASSPAPGAQVAPGQAQALAPSSAGSGTALAGGGDLGAMLRHGILGCANLAGLSRAEREGCQDKLGAGAKHETVLSEGRDPRIQAYFDAVAKAKGRDKPWTPTRAIGAMGIGQDVPRYSNDRAGGIGCVIPFGPKPKLPVHWLKLGPCFIAPPKGPLTVEVDITPPDQDLSHPAARSGPQPPPGARLKDRHEIAAAAPASMPTPERDKAKDADGETPPR